MRGTAYALVVALTYSLVVPPVFCDVIHLKNGNTLRAHIISENDDSVQVEMPFGHVEFSPEEIKVIERDDLGYVVSEREHSETRENTQGEASRSPVETSVASEEGEEKLPPEEIAKLDLLISALSSENIATVDKAYDGLVAAGKKAVPYLTNALNNARPLEAPHIMAALYTIDRDKAFNAVAAKTRHSDRMVRQATVILLGEMRERRATELLVDSLSDKKFDVRREVAKALGRIGDRASIAALVKATGDNDTEVRRAAADALGMITKKKLGSHQEWERWWSRQSARTGDTRHTPKG